MKLALFSAAILATGLTNAATPIDGWYASVFGGYTYLPGNVNKTTLGLTRTDAGYDAGYNAGGSLGYKSNPMRYEGQLTYLKANLDKFQINGVQQTGVTGYNNAFFALANVYYDFHNILPAGIQPFLGLGIGYGWLNAHLNSTGPSGITLYQTNGSVFAYQGSAGLTYNFSETYALNIAYRYIGTDKFDNLGQSFQAHLASAGVTYRFDGVRYK